MYGRVPEPWWLRPAASMVTQTNQIYVYMQIVRGRLGEIYVYIALQASPILTVRNYLNELSMYVGNLNVNVLCCGIKQ